MSAHRSIIEILETGLYSAGSPEAADDLSTWFIQRVRNWSFVLTWSNLQDLCKNINSKKINLTKDFNRRIIKMQMPP